MGDIHPKMNRIKYRTQKKCKRQWWIQHPDENTCEYRSCKWDSLWDVRFSHSVITGVTFYIFDMHMPLLHPRCIRIHSLRVRVKLGMWQTTLWRIPGHTKSACTFFGWSSMPTETTGTARWFSISDWIAGPALPLGSIVAAVSSISASSTSILNSVNQGDSILPNLSKDYRNNPLVSRS